MDEWIFGQHLVEKMDASATDLGRVTGCSDGEEGE